MQKFLVPFAIGAAVALAVQFFQKNDEPAQVESQATQVENTSSTTP